MKIFVWLGAVLCLASVVGTAAAAKVNPRQPGAETCWIEDGGCTRLFEVALDELSLPVAAGRREMQSVSAANSLAEIRARAVQMKQATGQDVELVLYEAGAERNVYTRRVLTKKVLVRAQPGTDLGAAALSAGGSAPVAVDYAPGFFLIETSETGGALELADRLRDQSGVLGADPLLARQQQKKWAPNDPLFAQQWHLLNNGQVGGTPGIDVKITNVWDRYRGSNILIGIVDDGLQTMHTDLWQNVNTTLDWDWNGQDSDPNPDLNYDYHGTSCAGVAAGRGNNGRGISGAAPEATLVGYRLIAGMEDDTMEASAMTTNNDVIYLKSNSWGPYDDGARLEAPGALTLAAIRNAVLTGRGGRGTIFLWAGGNGLQSFDDSNYDGYANSIYTIAVAALTDGGVQSWYSEPGANLVVTAPSSGGAADIATTDLMGNNGYNQYGTADELSDKNYTKNFGGTSSATPLVSGILALVLQANPNLGWRDVQEILIRSATQNDAADADWSTNSAGFTFNHKYGSGLVNAQAAVTLATNWVNLGPQVQVSVVRTNLNTPIPDNDPNGIVQTFTLAATNVRVEQVTVTLDIQHPYRGDLAVTLTSPSGMQSRLAEQHNDYNANYSSWTFSSVRHWGEEAQGVWTLAIADLSEEDAGTLRWARVEFYGTGLTPASNQAPALEYIGPQTLVVSNRRSFAVTAVDPVDGDSVRLWATNVPVWASFPGVTNAGGAASTFSGTPTEAGVSTVYFFAADKDGTNTEAVVITVNEAGGMETFDNFLPETAAFASGNFVGQDGSSWSYLQTRGDIPIVDKSPTLRNASNTFIRSGTILGGVGDLQFEYRKPFTVPAELGLKVYVIGSSGTYTGTVMRVPMATNEVLVFSAPAVNISGDVVLSFSNVLGTAAITIDNIQWTGYMASASPAPQPIVNWISPLGSMGASMQIATTVGIVYALQYTTDLAGLPPIWIQVDSTMGTGGNVTLQDMDTNSLRRFYRIVRP
jgi:subtilisin-like proprotein convertase family protein